MNKYFYVVNALLLYKNFALFLFFFKWSSPNRWQC